MSKIKILSILGFWIAVLPYLGFPYVFKNILLTLSGLTIVYLSYVLSKENKEGEEKIIFENFSENHDFVEKQNEDTKNVI